MLKRGTGIFAALLLVLVLCGAATRALAAETAPEQQVPVGTAAAKVRDVPDYLDGLGTVQSLNIVQVTAQVNGTLIALPVEQGKEVKQGEIVAQIDPRPYQAALDQAKAQRDEDSALLESASLDLNRYAQLAKSNFAAIQQVDDQRATVNKDKAAVALDTAMVETATINLDYCTIRAPVAGHLSFYQLTVGNVVQANSATNPIMTIAQDKPISVVFTLPEADFQRIQDARARGPVPVVAINSQDASKILATGTLLTPNNSIDTTTGTISLKATFANQDDHLWPGQFVNARVQVDTFRNAVTVPVPAIQHGPDGLFAYIVKPDQTVDQVALQVGYEDNGIAVVTKGLSGNETVVVSGQSRLSPGAHVKATDASQSAASAQAPSPT
jgi:multidrug efflux system membrane fusion protein